MIKVFEPASGRIDLLVTSVTTDGLTSSRAIANLIGELRSEMSERSVSFSEVRIAGSRKTESFSK